MTKNPQNEVRKIKRKGEGGGGGKERKRKREEKRSLGHGYRLCQSFYFGKI